MKLSVVPLFVLLSAIPAAKALTEPVAAPAVVPAALPTLWSGTVESRELTKRDNAAVVLVDGLRYRICPRTTNDCPAIGQYANGTQMVLHCYTREDTTPINGDYGWGQVASNDYAYWVALAWGKYVSWEGSLPYCVASGMNSV